MAGTKKKAKKAPAKAKKEPKAQGEAFLEGLQLLAPQEHVAQVRPLWETLSPAERDAALALPLGVLRERAAAAAAEGAAAAEAEAAEAAAAGRVVVALEPLDALLEEGLRRSAARGTWKLWQWPPDGAEFADAEAFRRHVVARALTAEQRAALPRDEEGVRVAERPAEAALRQRMADLLARAHEHRAAAEEAAATAGRRAAPGAPARRADAAAPTPRDPNAELAALVLAAFESEHEALHRHVLHPATAYVCEALPEGGRASSRGDLHFEDLGRLPPDDAARLAEWLVERVDALTAKLRPEARELEAEEEEEPIGDVDLFTLAPLGEGAECASAAAVVDGAAADADGAAADAAAADAAAPPPPLAPLAAAAPADGALRVDPRWLGHLASRVLGEDGQPRRAAPGEDPTGAGLVLEWVYGTIVSTAEKARDAAARPLGGAAPSAEAAVEALAAAAGEQAGWESRARGGRELLAQMLASRREAAALAERHDMRTVLPPAPPPAEGAEGGAAAAAAPAAPLPELPSRVALAMLRREALLTAAKLHYLGFQHLEAERALRALRAQLRRGEPEFARLKRALEDAKAAPRALEGSFRSAAEMERHRAALADAAIEGQMEAQAAFREAGARLQRALDERRGTEAAMSRREQEMKQLTNWRATVLGIAARLEALAGLEDGEDAGGALPDAAPLPEEVDEEAGEVSPAARAAAEAAAAGRPPPAEELRKLRANFHGDIRRQLYDARDDLAIFDAVTAQLAAVERRLDDGRAALQHLEQYAVNAACDDPGIAIAGLLALPLLQERLDTRALAHAAAAAAAAEDAVLAMEVEGEARAREDRERRAKAKAKARERAREERERERAAAEAAAAKARAASASASAAADAAAAAERARRAEEVEAQRREAEAAMEARRAELLADADSHWARRREQDGLAAAQAALEDELRQAAAAGGAPDADGFVRAGARPKAKARAAPAPRERPTPRERPACPERPVLVRRPAAAAPASPAKAAPPPPAPGTPEAAPPPAAAAAPAPASPPPPPPPPPPRAQRPAAAEAPEAAAAPSPPPPPPLPPPFPAAALPPHMLPPHMLPPHLAGMVFYPGPPGAGGAPPPPPPPHHLPRSGGPPLVTHFPLPPGMVPLPGVHFHPGMPPPPPHALLAPPPGAATRLRASAAAFVPGGAPPAVAAAPEPPAAPGAHEGKAPPPSPRAILEAAPPAPGAPPPAAELASHASTATASGSDGGSQGAPEADAEAAPAPPARAPAAVRGLSNAPGLHNCFLNAVLQCLWALRPVRAALTAPPAPGAARPRGAPADVAVLDALRAVFAALDAEGDAVEGAAANGAAPSDAAVAAARPPVSPRALRAALGSGAGAGAAFARADMHDAAEVLGALLESLHRAEAGGADDPALPRRVRLPAEEAAGWAAPAAPAAAAAPAAPPPSPPRAAGAAWGDSEKLRRVRRAPPAGAGAARSLAQRLFGLEVQAAASGAALGAPGAPAAGAPVEVLQFTKFVHLVPAEGLRAAAAAAAAVPGAAPDFEAALRAVDGHAAAPAARLLSRPAALTLGLGWDSPAAPPTAIAATLAALGARLDAGRLFAHDAAAGPPPGAYTLRALAAYGSNHYAAYVRADAAGGPAAAGRWLLVDDAAVADAGGWADVAAALAARRLQPSLLFYEAE